MNTVQTFCATTQDATAANAKIQSPRKPRKLVDTIEVPNHATIAQWFTAAEYSGDPGAPHQTTLPIPTPQHLVSLSPVVTGELPVFGKVSTPVEDAVSAIQKEMGKPIVKTDEPKFDGDFHWRLGGNLSRKIQERETILYVFIDTDTKLAIWSLNKAISEWLKAFRTLIERMPAVTYTVSDIQSHNHPQLGFATIKFANRFNDKIANLLHQGENPNKRFDQALCTSALMSQYTPTHRTLTFNPARWNKSYRLNMGMQGKKGVPRIVYLCEEANAQKKKESVECDPAKRMSSAKDAAGSN
jgi:hypothetical protein